MNNNKKEIIWNLVNSGLAGALVFAGACVSGQITYNAVITAFFAGFVVAVTKFKDYWAKEKKEYSHNMFNFL